MGGIGRAVALIATRPALVSALLVLSGVALAAGEELRGEPAAAEPVAIVTALPTPSETPLPPPSPTPDPSPSPACQDPVQARADVRLRISAGLAERRAALDEVRTRARWASTVSAVDEADAMLADLAGRTDAFVAEMPCEQAIAGIDGIAERTVAAMTTVGELARSLLAAERTPTPTIRVVAASRRQTPQPTWRRATVTQRPTPTPTARPTLRPTPVPTIHR